MKIENIAWSIAFTFGKFFFIYFCFLMGKMLARGQKEKEETDLFTIIYLTAAIVGICGVISVIINHTSFQKIIIIFCTSLIPTIWGFFNELYPTKKNKYNSDNSFDDNTA